MTAQAEFTGKAFDQVFDSFKKAADSTLQMQQELFGRWTNLWPGVSSPQASWTEHLPRFQKDWTQTQTELSRRFMEAWERQQKASLQALEDAFKIGESKDPEELRQKVFELWQKSFECLKEFAQAQARNFQTSVEKWMELAKKANP